MIRLSIIFFASCALLLLLAFPHTLFANNFSDNYSYSEEELSTALIPAVVRINAHSEGTVNVSSFKINLKKFTVSSSPGGGPLTIPINLTVKGTGFIINPDGYILTNSSIVSDYGMKVKIIEPIIDVALEFEEKKLSKTEIANLSDNHEYNEILAYKRELLDYVIKNSTFDITKKITVYHPFSIGYDAGSLIDHGLIAEQIYTNENWLHDYKDIAVIKVREIDLPSMRLGNSLSVTMGTPLFIANLTTRASENPNILPSYTFTKGIIVDLNNTHSNEFNIFKTAIKISSESAGGPMVNNDGRVIGIVSLMNEEVNLMGGSPSLFQLTAGKTASALPIELAKKILSDELIINDTGSYASHFQTGLALYYDRHCQKAIEEFENAKKVNSKINVELQINPYIDKCNDLVFSGNSIDSFHAELLEFVRSLNMNMWVMILSAFIILTMIFMISHLILRRIHYDKIKLMSLEHVIEHKKVDVSSMPDYNLEYDELNRHESIQNKVVNNGPEEGTTEFSNTSLERQLKESAETKPELLLYIKTARKAGLTFQQIEVELKQAGWKDDEISRAFTNPI